MQRLGRQRGGGQGKVLVQVGLRGKENGAGGLVCAGVRRGLEDKNVPPGGERYPAAMRQVLRRPAIYLDPRGGNWYELGFLIGLRDREPARDAKPADGLRHGLSRRSGGRKGNPLVKVGLRGQVNVPGLGAKAQGRRGLERDDMFPGGKLCPASEGQGGDWLTVHLHPLRGHSHQRGFWAGRTGRDPAGNSVPTDLMQGGGCQDVCNASHSLWSECLRCKTGRFRCLEQLVMGWRNHCRD